MMEALRLHEDDPHAMAPSPTLRRDPSTVSHSDYNVRVKWQEDGTFGDDDEDEDESEDEHEQEIPNREAMKKMHEDIMDKKQNKSKKRRRGRNFTGAAVVDGDKSSSNLRGSKVKGPKSSARPADFE